jgi:hypothetical protein
LNCLNFDFFVPENIKDAGSIDQRIPRGFVVINVNVAVEVIGWLKNLVKPKESLDTAVGEVGLVVDLPGWRVGNKNIQVTAISQPVIYQLGDKTENFKPHFPLGILMGAVVILQAAFNPGEKESCFITVYPSVQIDGTPGSRFIFLLAIINGVGMIPKNEIHGDIQRTHDSDLDIADSQDFHFRGKPFFLESGRIVAACSNRCGDCHDQVS